MLLWELQMEEVRTVAGCLTFRVNITSSAYFGLVRSLAFYESLLLPPPSCPSAPMDFYLAIVFLFSHVYFGYFFAA